MVNNNILLDKKVYVGPFIPRRVRVQQLEKSWTNVFIKDIDPAITDAELLQAFSPFGNVTSAVIMKKEDTSLGFGFVNYSDHESAVNAVNHMHQTKLGGKVLYCCRAQKKSEREAKLRKEWEQLKISKYQGINLYIKNIEDEIDEERLRKEFSAYGTIKSCKIMLDEKGNSKGFGFVCFNTQEESNRAMQEMNGRTLPGCSKPLYVAMHEPKEVRRQKLTMTTFKVRPGMQGPGAPIYTPTTGQPVYYQQQQLIYQQPMLPSMPRGWQAHTQYPGMPYSANNVGVIPPRGAAASNTPNRSRPAGAGAARSTGGPSGRGGNRRSSPQTTAAPDTAPSAPAPQEVEQVTVSQVKTFPLDQQKLYIGERLYSLIYPQQPELAGKITGMFLESGWSMDELYGLLSDEAKLAEKIEDAISVLERASAVEGV